MLANIQKVSTFFFCLPTSTHCLIQKWPAMASQFCEQVMYNSRSNSFFLMLPSNTSTNFCLMPGWEQRRPDRKAGSSLAVSSPASVSSLYQHKYMAYKSQLINSKSLRALREIGLKYRNPHTAK